MEAALSNRFIEFARLECDGSSPLYKALSMEVGSDPDLLELCSNAKEGQPVPNLLFGAVHYLLHNSHHPLRRYYKSLVESPLQEEDAFPHFKDFCRQYENEIQNLLKTKRVQTNEVRRCAYLYPVFCHIHEQTGAPLSMIEIGSSAGLQMLWDHYCYSYGDGQSYGNPHSPVHLASEVRRGSRPHFRKGSPPVASRVGIDLHISDLMDPEQCLWLKALIWPEHEERRVLFEQAVDQFKKHSPRLLEGDGLALLKEEASHAPEGSVLCIYHTHVANQMPEFVKEKLLKTIQEIGRRRDIFHVYNNIHDRKLHVDSIIEGHEHSQVMGETDGHGRWFDWHLSS
ncbi:DUF2332 domain-containing protein [Halobacillus yeomjeoni]|uniref:DUF2332 domain-containing protein n=1 Tax=Halobacillus yeomjeoni TaxID=311194 RepID=UPI001CD59B1A|nr:DUF2332 domain-containing protein [Halobacillus yeomjeoni]MCA0983207.1 DUF2332 domain-containing protein [Halobacillus yeomjeoni]